MCDENPQLNGKSVLNDIKIKLRKYAKMEKIRYSAKIISRIKRLKRRNLDDPNILKLLESLKTIKTYKPDDVILFLFRKLYVQNFKIRSEQRLLNNLATGKKLTHYANTLIQLHKCSLDNIDKIIHNKVNVVKSKPNTKKLVPTFEKSIVSRYELVKIKPPLSEKHVSQSNSIQKLNLQTLLSEGKSEYTSFNPKSKFKSEALSESNAIEFDPFFSDNTVAKIPEVKKRHAFVESQNKGMKFQTAFMDTLTSRHDAKFSKLQKDNMYKNKTKKKNNFGNPNENLFPRLPKANKAERNMSNNHNNMRKTRPPFQKTEMDNKESENLHPSWAAKRKLKVSNAIKIDTNINNNANKRNKMDLLKESLPKPKNHIVFDDDDD